MLGLWTFISKICREVVWGTQSWRKIGLGCQVPRNECWCGLRGQKAGVKICLGWGDWRCLKSFLVLFFHVLSSFLIFACFPLSCKPFLPSVSSLDIDHESWLDCVSYLRGELLSQKDRLLHLWRKVSNPKDLVGQWIVLHVCTTCFCMFVRFLIHTSPPDFSEFHSGRQTLTDGTTFMPSVQEPKYSSQTQLWCLVSSGHFWLQRWGCSAASACIL